MRFLSHSSILGLLGSLVVLSSKLIADERGGHFEKKLLRIIKSGSVLVDPSSDVFSKLDHPGLVLIVQKAAHVGKLLHGGYLLEVESVRDLGGLHRLLYKLLHKLLHELLDRLLDHGALGLDGSGQKSVLGANLLRLLNDFCDKSSLLSRLRLFDLLGLG